MSFQYVLFQTQPYEVEVMGGWITHFCTEYDVYMGSKTGPAPLTIDVTPCSNFRAKGVCFYLVRIGFVLG